MMPLQVQIGSQSGNDGSVVNQRGDNYGSTVVQQFNGKYAELARRGQLFMASSAVGGLAILLTTTNGGGLPTLWNPAGSGKICYLTHLSLNWLSGTTTASALIFHKLLNAGSTAATGAPILTFTNTAPVPAMLGASAASSMLWSGGGANTFTVAPTILCSTGVSLKAAAEDYVIDVDYDGRIAILPGNAITLACSVATTTALLQYTIYFAELPLPSGVV
jgi:hypothetical protein